MIDNLQLMRSPPSPQRQLLTLTHTLDLPERHLLHMVSLDTWLLLRIVDAGACCVAATTWCSESWRVTTRWRRAQFLLSSPSAASRALSCLLRPPVCALLQRRFSLTLKPLPPSPIPYPLLQWQGTRMSTITSSRVSFLHPTHVRLKPHVAYITAFSLPDLRAVQSCSSEIVELERVICCSDSHEMRLT